jgi:hypothetical protein
MRGSVRDALSVVVGLVGLVMLGIGLDRMLNTGSCASGGPYVSARPCPDDTVWWTVLLAGGMIIWMAGLVLSRQGLVQPGTGQLLWTAGFAGLGATALIKAGVQDSMPADARLGAYIVGALCIPMGLAVGIAGLVQLRRERRRARKAERPRAPDTPERRLQRLRSTGVLTRAEFERLRATIADPGTAERLAILQQLAEDNAAGRLAEAEYADRKRATLAP